jgi:UDP-GlcNAc3NAcA epimerase
MGIRIATIVGARPQFIKAAAVSRVIRNDYAGRISEVLVHTGQHYDARMSRVFFEELDLPPPDHHLGIAGGRHGAMTGRMLGAIETVLLAEQPDIVLVYGDTNSTLAGALAAVKLHVPVAHVEAGLRSFNRRMPEEINRLLTDRVSSLLFCPTTTAVENLAAEGITAGVHHVGDVMYDVALFYRDRARQRSNVLERFGLRAGEYALATCHRAENTDDANRLREICLGLAEVASMLPVVFPVHPRTNAALATHRLKPCLTGVTLVDPLPFLDIVALQQAARAIITDSGGMQKEAFFFRVPCITIRDETEWVETVAADWNRLAGASRERIVSAYHSIPQRSLDQEERPFGDGLAAHRIVSILSGSPGFETEANS